MCIDLIGGATQVSVLHEATTDGGFFGRRAGEWLSRFRARSRGACLRNLRRFVENTAARQLAETVFQ